MKKCIGKFLPDQRGLTTVEYAVAGGLVVATLVRAVRRPGSSPRMPPMVRLALATQIGVLLPSLASAALAEAKRSRTGAGVTSTRIDSGAEVHERHGSRVQLIDAS